MSNLVLFVLTGAAVGCSGASAEAPPMPPAPPPAPTAEAPATTPPKEDPSLVARELLFGNPNKAAAKISPDGKQLAYLAPVDGVLNVFVGPADDPSKAKPVTSDKKRGIRRYAWAYTNQHILYLQDQGGDENWRAYAVDLKSGKEKDLTPLEGVQARLEGVSHKSPNTIVVALNDRDKRLHDLYKVDIGSGKRTLLQKNEGGFVGFMIDDDYRVKLAVKFTQTGAQELLKPAGKEWKPFVSIGLQDAMTTSPVGFDQSGRTLYMTDSRDRDKAAFVTVDMTTAKKKVFYESTKADVSSVWIAPKTKKIQAVGYEHTRVEWGFLDPAVKDDVSVIDEALSGDFDVVSRTLDDQAWVLAETRDDGPVYYHHYDRKKKALRTLFSSRPALDQVKLTKMHPVVIKTRDGLDLVSYLSLPLNADPDGDGRPDKALPMVLKVHGGPWGRDRWGFNGTHQWLASRGYAVLSVNYRGSTGFGKQFINAADGEWAGKMHDDLLDAVKWTVDEKIAQADKVAIFGGSYGGYATLVGLTFTPDQFACGVDIVGPSSLVTLLENIPPYWAPFAPVLNERVGNPKTTAGRTFLHSRSPLNHVEKIARPLLIAQGANDPRVKQAESDQIVSAMQKKNIPVAYALYPDEGHGFARPENRLSFYAVSEIFLAQCLGGSYQPVGSDFDGSSITMPAGADYVHSVAGALSSKKP